jgi:hypothetical protein
MLNHDREPSGLANLNERRNEKNVTLIAAEAADLIRSLVIRRPFNRQCRNQTEEVVMQIAKQDPCRPL